MTLDILLKEDRIFPPPTEFARTASVNSSTAYNSNQINQWEQFASELHWFKPWDRTLEWQAPFAKWFIGGKTNMSFNCIDRHLQNKKNKPAIIWEGEPGDNRTMTYQELHNEVCKFSNGLKSVGLKKGDLVTIYMPMIPEAVIAMLACTRIGAPHSVVFGGFSAEALRDRINDSKSKVVITSDGGWRRGSIVPLKANTDDAVKGCKSIEKIIVVNRTSQTQDAKCKMQNGRDIWYHDLIQNQPDNCEAEQMDSEDLLYILYTSGTTGKPKGITHTTGGYMTGVYATTKWVFDIKDTDIYWCSADVGWVTGHSYVVYGPLLNGSTVLIYEGAPNYPGNDRFWSIIEKHKATIFYTAPTAIRSFMKLGRELPQAHNLSSLRLLGSVGEPINPEAWMWYHEIIGHGKCPIVDTWWQTETGHILISPLPGVTKLKPGSATLPFPGIDADVVNDKGESVDAGYLVIKSPWPGMLRGIYGDEERYKKQYWSKFPNWYFTGDGAKKDKDGYFWLLGRVDDVLKVSGHRLSTMEIESALVDHKSVAESAVIGKHHAIKENSIIAFVSLKSRIKGTPSLVHELKEHVVKKIGSIARPDEIILTAEMPKTRSGKIMRRLLRDIAEGRTIGDTTTLADSNVIKELKEQYETEEA